jgi:heat shock protein HtpX
VLSSERARPIAVPGWGLTPQLTPVEVTLLDVVREISIAANLPPPAVYVINDASPNALAVGTRPGNAAIAVTSGLLSTMDREQLQGVVAHEIGHIRNLDSRYGVYVAILVGLVALVTDGFLRMVLEGWKQGVFLRGGEIDDDKGALAGLAAGALFGLLLLAVAGFLRIFAPLAALLVQAAVSRQREYLADATSVELSRNPTGLARALATIRDNQLPLARPNRGSQHLWFANPLGREGDGRSSLFATHPTLDARIARLDALYPGGRIPAR